MSASRPPGNLRALWLVARLGARRWLNRVGSLSARRRKPGQPAGARQATPRKRAASGVLFSILALFMVAVGVFQAARLVRRVVTIGAPIQMVSPYLYNSFRLRSDWGTPGEHGLRTLDAETRERLREQVEDDMRNFSRGERRGQEQLERESAALVAHYELHGLGGFAVDAPVPLFDEREAPWPAPEFESPSLRTFGALLLAIGLMVVLSSLGGGNQDLGRVEWSFEWLYSLPASGHALFGAKLLEYTLVNPMLWFTALPLLISMLLARGFGWAALPLALAGSAYLSLLAAALRLCTETWLRLHVRNLKNLQAVFTLAGSALFLLILWVVNAPSLPGTLVEWGPRFAATWNPLSLPVELCRKAGVLHGLVVVAGMLAYAVTGVLLSVWACERLVRGGLLVSAGSFQGKRGEARKATAAAHRPDRRPAWLRGALGKDLRLLLRDRNFLVQTLVVPLLVLGLQLVMNRGLLEAVANDFHHAATLAFAMGAYMLVFSAAGILSVEGNALWLLYTLPRPLHRVLLGKALMWAAIATLYTAAALAAAMALNEDPRPGNAIDLAAALVGVPIYAFIASGLGALATDPLEQEVQRRVAPSTIYMYMLLAGMYSYAIYAPSPWAKLVQALLSGLLAFALWQKLRDRIPYLLDPTEAPPARLSLSDGMIAALAFFTAQGVCFLLLDDSRMPRGARLLTSFAIAGLAVTLGSLYLLKRAKVQGLLGAVGLRREPGSAQKSAATNLGLGAVAGLGASLPALGYVYLLGRLPKLPEWMKVESPLQDLGPGAAPFIFALAVLAAPLFEEYLFRGLLFRGMQRSMGTWRAIAASAAIFAAVHPAISAVPVFVLGVAAAASFQRGGLLLAPIAAHAVYNAVVIGVRSWAGQ